MSSKHSLDELVAFEEEAAEERRQTEAPPPPLPRLSGGVWGALTAQFRVPPTFVMRWNALSIRRRKRVRRLLIVLAATVIAAAGYFVSTLPVVRARATGAWQRFELAVAPYVAQARDLLARDEVPRPEAQPDPVTAAAAHLGAGQVEGAAGTVERRHSRGRRRATDRRYAKAKRPGKDAGHRKAAPRAQAFTRETIVAAVRKQMSSLAPCIKRARAAGEIVPGRHIFVLDWEIEPSGAVSRPALRGPAGVLRSSLPACFAAQMGGWRFPRAAESTPVSRFPLPVTVP